jgi:hypothetical protein
MVWVPLKNGDGQVVKDIKLKSPEGKTYTVTGTSRKGINKYSISMKSADGSTRSVMNYQIMKKKSDPNHEPWSVVGGFHSPEKLAKLFNKKKVDPDANKPRPQRKSFWAQKNSPDSHSGKQKAKLMATEPEKYKKFEEVYHAAMAEGPKDAAGKDLFVKKIAKQKGISYKDASAVAAVAGRKRMGAAKFNAKAAAGRKAAARAKAAGKIYKG